MQKSQEIGRTRTIKRDFDIQIFMGSTSAFIIVAWDA